MPLPARITAARPGTRTCAGRGALVRRHGVQGDAEQQAELFGDALQIEESASRRLPLQWSGVARPVQASASTRASPRGEKRVPISKS